MFNSESSDAQAESLLTTLVAKRIRRQRLTERQTRLLLLHRYGSITDFSKVIASFSVVAKATGIASPTIHRAIHRYHRNGDCFVEAKVVYKGRRKKVPAAVEKELCSYEVLTEMRFLPLMRRTHLIETKYGIELSVSGL